MHPFKLDFAAIFTEAVDFFCALVRKAVSSIVLRSSSLLSCVATWIERQGPLTYLYSCLHGRIFAIKTCIVYLVLLFTNYDAQSFRSNLLCMSVTLILT